jgi:hypothetical protein
MQAKENSIFALNAMNCLYFAHKSSQCSLNNEGWIHLSAKYKIRYLIEEWLSGNTNAPVLIRKCPICNERKEQVVPDSVKLIEFEKVIGDFRVDVVLCDELGNILCGIEVRDTHPVDEQKREASTHPWFEVSAEQILMEQSNDLYVLQEGNLKQYYCKCWTGVRMKVVQRGLAKWKRMTKINNKVLIGNKRNQCTTLSE